MTTLDVLDYYAAHGALTEPHGQAPDFAALPADVSALCEVVQGLIVHVEWASRYGIAEGAAGSRDTLPVSRRLALVKAVRHGPISVARPPNARTPGTCRDFALMLCSMLRHRAIPARVRCGFATYFAARPWEDHWVCEYWNPARQQWALADAQLDELHRDARNIDFDIADLPPGKFLNAGQAWQMCRSGACDPADFGHGADGGLWFVRVNVMRDMLALHKQETSAWDTWRAATPDSKVLDASTLSLCDRIAEATASIGDRSIEVPDLSAVVAASQMPPWRPS